jgi:hypothetical protein
MGLRGPAGQGAISTRRNQWAQSALRSDGRRAPGIVDQGDLPRVCAIADDDRGYVLIAWSLFESLFNVLNPEKA